jgi:glutaredoxin
MAVVRMICAALIALGCTTNSEELSTPGGSWPDGPTEQLAGPKLSQVREVLSDPSRSHEERAEAFVDLDPKTLAIDETRAGSDGSEEESARTPGVLDDARQLVAVTMYANQTCPVCRRARKYFRENDIAFVEYDVDASPEARAKYESLSQKRRLPTIQIDDELMNGFSELGVDRAIERSAKKRL